MNTYVVTLPLAPGAPTSKLKHYVIEADFMQIAEATDFNRQKTSASSVLLFYRRQADQGQFSPPIYAALRDWDTCFQVDDSQADRTRTHRVEETLKRIQDGDG